MGTAGLLSTVPAAASLRMASADVEPAAEPVKKTRKRKASTPVDSA